MSRGLGTMQRHILEAATNAVDPATGRPTWVAVDEIGRTSVSVGEVTPDADRQHLDRSRLKINDKTWVWRTPLTKSEREVLCRAVRTLAARGLVEAGNAWHVQGRADWRFVRTFRLALTPTQRMAEVEQYLAEAQANLDGVEDGSHYVAQFRDTYGRHIRYWTAERKRVLKKLAAVSS
jgi:hypothetical protein